MKDKKNFRFLIFFLGLTLVWACISHDKKEVQTKNKLMKGLYNFGPEMKYFADCDNDGEYWVTDSSNNLELEYQKMGFDKPYLPVYIEVEAHLKKSDSTAINGGYDSTMVVTKLIKMSKEAPDGACIQ